jgi:hypothetical protein
MTNRSYYFNYYITADIDLSDDTEFAKLRGILDLIQSVEIDYMLTVSEIRLKKENLNVQVDYEMLTEIIHNFREVVVFDCLPINDFKLLQDYKVEKLDLFKLQIENPVLLEEERKDFEYVNENIYRAFTHSGYGIGEKMTISYIDFDEIFIHKSQKLTKYQQK